MSTTDERAQAVLDQMRAAHKHYGFDWMAFGLFGYSVFTPNRRWPVPETAVRLRLRQLVDAGLVEKRGYPPVTEWRIVEP